MVCCHHGGSSGGDRQLGLGLSALELLGLRPAQRLQPALIPGGQQLRADTHGAPGGVPAVRAAGEELHQRVGDSEEGEEQTITTPSLHSFIYSFIHSFRGEAPSHQTQNETDSEKINHKGPDQIKTVAGERGKHLSSVSDVC